MNQARTSSPVRETVHSISASFSPVVPVTMWSRWMWLAPFAVVLLYPWALDAFHAEVADAHGMTALAWFWILCAYAVPAIGLLGAHRLGAGKDMPTMQILAARLSHLVVAAPPLFTMAGVFLYLMKINGHDGAVWTGLWGVLAMAGSLLMATASDNVAVEHLGSDANRHAKLRTIHGVTSVLLLVVFLLPHLFNHVTGLWGMDAHHAVMKALRVVYRNGLLEPLIISVFSFQILSGLVLFRRKSATNRDLLDTLQTASGIYLTAFIASHINSVFTLARYFGTETDYAWAVGAPTGLLLDGWSIRLVPHYSLAVFFLIVHLACATRLIMRKHNAPAARANAVAWSIAASGLLLSAVITAAMLGARLNHLA